MRSIEVISSASRRKWSKTEFVTHALPMNPTGIKTSSSSGANIAIVGLNLSIFTPILSAFPLFVQYSRG